MISILPLKSAYAISIVSTAISLCLISGFINLAEAQPTDTRAQVFKGQSRGLGFTNHDDVKTRRPKIHVEFTHSVKPNQVKRHCAYYHQEQVGKEERVTRVRPQLISPIHESRKHLVEPASQLPWGTRWTFLCTQDLQSAALGKLSIFKRIHLYIVEGLSGSGSPSEDKDHVRPEGLIYLHFNHQVLTSEIPKSCIYRQVNTGQHYAVQLSRKYDVARPRYSFYVKSSTKLPLNSAFTFSCSGLKSIEDGIPLVKFDTVQFNTYGPLTYKSFNYDQRATPDRKSHVKLSFTNALKAPYLLTVHPPIKNLTDHCYSSSYQQMLTCRVPLAPNQTYEFTLDGAQKDIYGQTLGQTQKLQVTTQDNLPAVAMETGYYIAELHRPVFPFWSQNTRSVNLLIAEVTPEEFYTIQHELDWWSDDPIKLEKLPTTIFRSTYKTTGDMNQWRQHLVDPAKLLHRPVRSGMYYIEVSSKEVKEESKTPHHRKSLVNFTDLGVVSKIANAQGMVWVTRLSTGTSIKGAQVIVRNGLGERVWRGETNDQGVVTLPPKGDLTRPQHLERLDPVFTKTGKTEKDRKDLAKHQAEMRVRRRKREEIYIFAHYENDWTMVNPKRGGSLSTSNFNISVDYSDSPTMLRGHLHTDRGLYQPGETVHIKGLARISHLGGALTPPKGERAKVYIQNPRGVRVSTQEVDVSPFGGFWLDYKVPKDARLGDYHLRAELKSGSFSRSFSVERFKPVTFEVHGKSKTKRIVGSGQLSAEMSARYLYGAPLREGSVKASVYSRPKNLSFKQFKDFTFHNSLNSYHSLYSDQRLITSEKFKLNPDGTQNINITLKEASELDHDVDLLMRLDVSAPSNEVISKSFVIPYFQHQTYVGLKQSQEFIETGKHQTFEIISVDATGTRKASVAEVLVTRPEWNCVWEDFGYRGSYQCQKKTIEVIKKQIKIGADQPTEVSFKVEHGGEYEVKIKSADQHIASTDFYAWGGYSSYPSEDSATFELLADQESYQDGDEAILVLKTDLSYAKGLVSVERKGVIETWPIEMTPTTKFIKVPIKESYAPNVYVSVALVQPRTGLGNRAYPRMKMGMKALSVRPQENRLKVSVSSDRSDYQPGDQVTATVKVVDHQDQPVHAEVALTAADEGILALINYKTPDPIPTFYAPWGLGTRAASQYAYIKTIPSPNLDRPATGGDSGGLGTIRSRFLASAIWKPGLLTDNQGEARVSFKAPDNLTAFRMMAVAADSGQKFGSSDRRFTVSKPLQLHRSLPRFISLNDQFRAGVIVHNETGQAGEATVRLILDDKLSGRGVFAAQSDLTQRVSLKKGAQVPVLFDLEALELGETTMTFSVSLGAHRDAARFKIPVKHPSPIITERVKSGRIKGETTFTVPMPQDALTSSAEVLVSIDLNGLAGIENGLQELIRYPYGCLEQTTSKLIPMITVRNIAETLKLDGLSGDTLDDFVREGITKIGKHQTESGGFSLWIGGQAQPYYTAYALWGLYLAREAGYAVNASKVKSALSYLRRSYREGRADESYYNERYELGNRAFTLYIRSLLDDKDPQAAVKLSERFDEMSVYGQGVLTKTLALNLGSRDAKVKQLVAELDQTIKEAKQSWSLLGPKRKSSWYMSSPIRATSVVLDALVAADPNNTHIPYLVKRIMKERRAQKHLSTQAHLYSLLALMNYASSTPLKPTRVRVRMGQDQIMDQTLQGAERLAISKRRLKGSGRLQISSDHNVFYQTQVQFRRRADMIKPESNGVVLSRAYFDERGQPMTKFTVGDIVTVRLDLSLEDPAHHVMVSDHIPAGFEVLNERFATVGSSVGSANSNSRFFREVHAERVDFATERLWKKQHQIEYQMRAIAEGRFVLPPTRAELMYEPERNAQTRVSYIEVHPK